MDINTDGQRISILVVLGLTAAFDRADHCILIYRDQAGPNSFSSNVKDSVCVCR